MNDNQRCPICDWPMKSDPKDGCIPGNCCYRPDDPKEQRRIQERRKLNLLLNISRENQKLCSSGE